MIGGYGSMMTRSMMEGSIMGGSGSMIGGSSQDWFDPMMSGSGPMMDGAESMMSGSESLMRGTMMEGHGSGAASVIASGPVSQDYFKTNLTLSKDHFKTPL